MRVADASKQQTKIVVDFGDGANGRTWVVGNRLLVDGNRRRKPLNQIDFGAFEITQKLPGVGRQTFDIATLAFGKKGVEGHGRLAGAGDTGKDDQLIFGEFKRHCLEIVFGSPLDDDFILTELVWVHRLIRFV